MDIDISFEESSSTIAVEPLHTFLEHVLHAAGEDESEVSVALVSDASIQEINRSYRGIDQATDVLSFASREGDPIGRREVLGDLMVSLETAERQAKEFGHSLEHELYELLFHGFIHLMGYDHEADPHAWSVYEKQLRDRLSKTCSTYIPLGLTLTGNKS